LFSFFVNELAVTRGAPAQNYNQEVWA